MREAVFGHISKSRRHQFNGIRRSLIDNCEFRLLEGHYPYGLHPLFGVRSPRYFVMLRDPVERAVSHYHFIRACTSPTYVHPRIEDARENSLSGFYRKARYQNMQTRFAAGLLWEYAGRYVSLNGLLGHWALRRAKRNLMEEYEAFGLKERFQESARLFAGRLGTNAEIPERKHKKTANRPEVEELSETTVEELNMLDVELYQFAVDHFEKQFDA